MGKIYLLKRPVRRGTNLLSERLRTRLRCDACGGQALSYQQDAMTNTAQ